MTPREVGTLLIGLILALCGIVTLTACEITTGRDSTPYPDVQHISPTPYPGHWSPR